VLGVLFLFGQALAWQRLKDLGVYVATSPSSSFFYILTASSRFSTWWEAWRRSSMSPSSR